MSEQQPRQVLPKLLHFVRKEQISQHLVRVFVTGEELTGLTEDCHGAHIKLFFANQHSGVLQLPVFHEGEVSWPEHKPVSRAYSVRWYDPVANEMAIDFVLHGDDSPGSGWAIHAKPGDYIGMAGPAGPNPLLAPADWHLLVGDLTALPAISAVVERLPQQACGEVWIELDSLQDRIEVKHPAGISINWKLRSAEDPMPLVKQIKSIVPPSEAQSLSAFIAGENSTVVECRRYLTQHLGIDRKRVYAVPYWKRGVTEEAYHMERHAVMDAVD
ncbi:siderophore-interacting protein [Vibrio sp. CDRSL-10 TSBA]